MTLSAPNFTIFVISAVLALIALLAAFKVPMPGNSDHAVYVALVAYGILVAGVLL